MLRHTKWSVIGSGDLETAVEREFEAGCPVLSRDAVVVFRNY